MKLRLLWSTIFIVQAAGCTYPGLFFTEHTHTGAQIKLSPVDNTPLDVNIGYDRGLLTVVPRKERGKDAASVISKSDLDIVFFENSLVKNVFATGAAARNIMDEPERVEALFAICRASATIEDRKTNASAKLKSIKDDKQKVKDLYKKVFPNGKTTRKNAQYEKLEAKLVDICDPERELSILRMYEALPELVKTE